MDYTSPLLIHGSVTLHAEANAMQSLTSTPFHGKSAGEMFNFMQAYSAGRKTETEQDCNVCLTGTKETQAVSVCMCVWGVGVK